MMVETLELPGARHDIESAEGQRAGDARNPADNRLDPARGRIGAAASTSRPEGARNEDGALVLIGEEAVRHAVEDGGRREPETNRPISASAGLRISAPTPAR